jgi:hypothetical protein
MDFILILKYNNNHHLPWFGTFVSLVHLIKNCIASNTNCQPPLSHSGGWQFTQFNLLALNKPLCLRKRAEPRYLQGLPTKAEIKKIMVLTIGGWPKKIGRMRYAPTVV